MLGLGLNLTSITAALLDFVRSGLKMWLPFERSEILGEDVHSGYDLEDWSALSNATINSPTTFTTSSTATGIFKIHVTSGSTYKLTIAGTTESNGLDFADAALSKVYYAKTGTGAFSDTAIFTAESTQIYLKNKTAGETTITTLKIEEVTQIAPDKSGNSNSATLYTGKALSFDGVNDSVDFTSIDLTGEFTIGIWFNVADALSDNGIYGDGTTADNVSIQASGQNFRFRINNSSTIFVFDSGSINTWYRLIITRDSSNLIKCYRNGVASTTTVTDSNTFSINNLGKGYTSWRYNGKASDFQIYDATWTQADVTFDYENPQHLVTDNSSIVKTYGSELVSKGDFTGITQAEDAVGDDWETGENWTIGNGVATANSVAHVLVQSVAISSGKTYEVQVDVNYISGTLYVQLGGSTAQAVTSSGTLKFITRRVNNNHLKFYGGSFTGSIDNVSVKEMTSLNIFDLKGYWHLSEGAGGFAYNSAVALGSELVTGWTNSDFDSFTSSGSNITQMVSGASADNCYSNSLTVTSGKTYKVEFTSSQNLSTNCQVRVSANTNLTSADVVSASVSEGLNTFVFTATGSRSYIGFYAAGSFTDTQITNFSFKEVSAGTAYDGNADDHDSDGTVLGATWVLQQPTIPQLGLMDWSKPTIGSDEITLISDPNDQSKDILGNDVRLREHSLNLDGSGYAKVDSDSSLDITNYSIDGWFYSTNNSSNYEAILTKLTQDNFEVYIRNSQLRYFNSTDSEKLLSAITLNAWTYFCITESSGTLKCYINDDSTPKSSQTVTQKFANTGSVYIGSHQSGDYSNALIDDIRVYNGVLSADEVLQNYKAGLSQHKPGSAFSDDFSSDYGI